MKTKNYYKLFLISTLLLLGGCGDGQKPTLHVYTWADYVSPELIAEFENFHRCSVSISTFDSNEVMFSKLKNGASGYDIIVPSSYMISTLANEGVLEKLDHAQLSYVCNCFDHSYDAFINDPSLTYSVPYAATYTGILYRKDRIKEPVDSWNAFLLKSIDGRASFLDDYREVIGAGLMANGYSLNSDDADELEDAVETVLKWKDASVKKFDAEAYKTEVASGALYMGHAYSSDAFQLMTNDGTDFESASDYEFVLPKEGFTIAFDEMAIMKSSKQKKLAYEFIEFLFFENRSVENMLYICSIMPQKNAVKRLPQKMQDMLVLKPEVLARGQVLRNFDANPEVQEQYNKAWDEIRRLKR